MLIPKKDGADKITYYNCSKKKINDYRPISLIYSVAKLLAKILALRLAPTMNETISKSQNAFIKGRSIHDNFVFVRNMSRCYHINKTPMLLVKLDISKAFDSVRCGITCYP